MKEQKNANKILYIIIAIIIVIGTIICLTKGFNIELVYLNRQEIVISNNTGMDLSKIQEMVNQELGDRKTKIQQLERFGNAVVITATTISEEEKQNIVNKVNEEYGEDLSNDDIFIENIPNTRIRDIIKPYILGGLISFVIVMVYFIIVYNKIGVRKILLKGILLPLITELTFYSIIAITRIPFGRCVNSIAIGIYIICIGILTIYFQKNKGELTNNQKKEND